MGEGREYRMGERVGVAERVQDARERKCERESGGRESIGCEERKCERE